MSIYRKYLHGQIEELLTGFGIIDILWFDFSFYDRYADEYEPILGGPRAWKEWFSETKKGAEAWGSEKIIEMVKELQPKAIIDDRLDIDGVGYSTPEHFQPNKWVEVDNHPVYWETCTTFSNRWIHSQEDITWKSSGELVQLLIDCVSKGGNLLINMGPTARGILDKETLISLKNYGEWMKLHSKSIYGCTMSEFTASPDSRYTQNGKKLYLHLFTWPLNNIHLEGLREKVEYAQLLNDGTEVKFKTIDQFPHKMWGRKFDFGLTKDSIILDIPHKRPDVVPVIEIFLK